MCYYHLVYLYIYFEIRCLVAQVNLELCVAEGDLVAQVSLELCVAKGDLESLIIGGWASSTVPSSQSAGDQT